MTAIAALQIWAATPLAHGLGLALLHFLWEGAVVAAALAILLAAVRSARARYAVAVSALMALPLVFAITWAVCARPTGAVLPAPHAPYLYRLPIALPAGNSIPAPPPDRLTWLVPLWMAGVGICYARSFTAWFAALRLRRRGVCAAPEFWQQRLRALCARLRIARPIVLLESCLAEVPVTFGWFRPVILLPIGLFAGLPQDQVEAILIHELAHIGRADYAVNLLATFVEGLLFYHPAVWWMSHVARAERENCCDDAVVAQNTDARSYAAALARLEHNRALAREAVLAANGGNLMNRIRRLLNEPERSRNISAPAFAAILVLVTVAASLAWTPTPKPQTASAEPQVSAPAVPLAPGQVLRPLLDLRKRPAKSTGDPVIDNYIERSVTQSIASLSQELAQTQDSAAKPLTEKQRQKREALPSQEPDSPYRKWLNEDVAYIITDQERAAFKNLPTNDEREKFIEQFWLVRDPTPGTPENEFKQEHYRRIAYANEHFSSSIPGWKTDRGRIYIIYGPPDEIEDHSKETAKAPYQQWRYRFIEGIGENVIIQFTDVRRDGSYPMDVDPAHSALAHTVDPLAAIGVQSKATFHSAGPQQPRISVGVWDNGVVGFGASSDLAAKAYSGTWAISVKGEIRTIMQGSFDSRGASKTLTLQPGAYTLRVNLHDPNGAPFSAEVAFTVE